MNKNGKPKTLKWAKALAILEIILGVALVVFLIWLVDANPQGEFLKGFRDGFIGALGDNGVYYYDYEMAGQVSAMPLVGVVAAVLTLFAIARRTKTLTYVALGFLGFHILGGLVNSLRVPLLSTVIFILMLTKSAKAYLGIAK